MKPAILTEIYYDLSIIYSMWQDDEGLHELSEAMKDLPVDFPFQQIHYRIILYGIVSCIGRYNAAK